MPRTGEQMRTVGSPARSKRRIEESFVKETMIRNYVSITPDSHIYRFESSAPACFDSEPFKSHPSKIRKNFPKKPLH